MNRRDFLSAMLAACAAPAIIPSAHAGVLMRCRGLLLPQYRCDAAYIEALLLRDGIVKGMEFKISRPLVMNTPHSTLAWSHIECNPDFVGDCLIRTNAEGVLISGNMLSSKVAAKTSTIAFGYDGWLR